MTEIQGKSILVRVSEGSSYRESTVFIIASIKKTLTWRFGWTTLKIMNLKRQFKLIEKYITKEKNTFTNNHNNPYLDSLLLKNRLRQREY